MSLRYLLEDWETGDLTEITDRCRTFKLNVQSNAEEGSVATSTVYIDDPDGDLHVGGWKQLIVIEDEADPGPVRIYRGYTYIREIARMDSNLTGPARTWVTQVVDLNTRLSTRVMVGNDNDRPAETAGDRLQWLIDTAEGNFITDTSMADTSDTEPMDANDYLGMERQAVLDDVAQQTGKNFFLTYLEIADIALFYDDWDSSTYESTGSITNDINEIDQDEGGLVFWAGKSQPSLNIDPSRVHSGVFLPYDGGYVYVRRKSTEDRFMFRDRVAPAETIKTRARALRRAQRYADDAREEVHRATLILTVPRSKVQVFREGMAIPVKMLHWPEPYRSEFVTMRCLTRKIEEVSEDDDSTYLLTLEVSRNDPGPPASATVYGHMHFARMAPGTPPAPTVTWDGHGSLPGSIYQDTTGLISPIASGDKYLGWLIEGDGVITGYCILSASGVKRSGGHNVTWSVCINGTPVESVISTLAPGLAYWNDLVRIDFTDLAVSNGDQLTAEVVATPNNPVYFGVAAGAGQQGESLVITGGTLV